MSILKKKALITGVKGQDGSFMVELLSSDKGNYQIIGTSHLVSDDDRDRYSHQDIVLEELDLLDDLKIKQLLEVHQPDEVYNLAARSSSAQLFDDPLSTAEINGLAVTRFLEAIRLVSPHTRFCQAASSEIFAGGDTSPQDENTPLRPINAYGAAKTYAANIVTAYRAQYGLFATTAILFNHESPRRGGEYVSRKIAQTVAKIALGRADKLILGNLDSRRDWGFAGDYVRAMWLMLQQQVAEDFVIATGVTHSVREFCDIAFSHVGLDYREFVRTDAKWGRRSEGIELCGNPARAKLRLGWQPVMEFPELVRMMVDADMASLKKIQSV